MKKDVFWFKTEIIPLISKKFSLTYSTFKNGDFGNLERIEFESKGMAGFIDFWCQGWLNIHLVDFESGYELLNVLLRPDEDAAQIRNIDRLKELLLQ